MIKVDEHGWIIDRNGVSLSPGTKVAFFNYTGINTGIITHYAPASIMVNICGGKRQIGKKDLNKIIALPESFTLDKSWHSYWSNQNL